MPVNISVGEERPFVVNLFSEDDIRALVMAEQFLHDQPITGVDEMDMLDFLNGDEDELRFFVSDDEQVEFSRLPALWEIW